MAAVRPRRLVLLLGLVTPCWLANSWSKNLAKTDASIKNHTGMHAKGHAEENASIKTLTGSRSKEGIGTDEPRIGGPEEPRYGRLAVNTRLASSRSKNLAKDLAEEDASTKTLRDARQGPR